MLVVVATWQEAEMAHNRWPDAHLIITGVGPTNVIHSLQSVERDREMINFGYECQVL